MLRKVDEILGGVGRGAELEIIRYAALSAWRRIAEPGAQRIILGDTPAKLFRF